MTTAAMDLEKLRVALHRMSRDNLFQRSTRSEPPSSRRSSASCSANGVPSKLLSMRQVKRPSSSSEHRQLGAVARAADVEGRDDAALGWSHAGRLVAEDEVVAGAAEDQCSAAKWLNGVEPIAVRGRCPLPAGSRLTSS